MSLFIFTRCFTLLHNPTPPSIACRQIIPTEREVGQSPRIVVEAFGYRPLNGTETLFSSNASTHGLSSHSTSPMHTGSLTTPPSTGLVSSAGGTYASTRRDLTGGDVDDPHSQVVVMPPYTSDGKYRPDLPSTSAPQLLPPPRRSQPITPQVQPQQPSAIIRDNRSQTASPSPFGAGQPVLGMPSGDREAEVRRQQQRQFQAVLSPVRRAMGVCKFSSPLLDWLRGMVPAREAWILL
ncbi:hypothetical protein CPB84DRAFT_384316 [Gymnopilus junonius]|uniref:Uncharacterized protein n=1 Tax=Gymnopilus junonius TaxID=109634 RepID=A0A9P5ND85_GYMJU|nr:hypothetical protein CPB84DRAFT_384316 [Gymnopilus junonius]